MSDDIGKRTDEQPEEELGGSEIAIVGIVGRFPGANTLEEYWRLIREGRDTIKHFTEEELKGAVHPDALKNPQYVAARGVIDDIENFDAGFFGYSPRDAKVMDPQQRLFLQGAWELLERGGYDPRTYEGLIGVYGGSTMSSYQPHVMMNLDPREGLDGMAVAMGNEITYLTTRVSYKLDLKGPSYPIQTACSTSMVAIHLACQGLLNAECDMAIAGGISIRAPQENGYLYQDGGILSPDGACRSFDSKAKGTIFSHGYGMLLLKRLDDALEDRDTIHAVILGSAINNDGSRKASFTAPGVTGQTEVIADALSSADVEPESIQYVEAHGTGTALGDSIEIQALNAAYSPYTSRKQFCGLGCVKANIGHLDTAAGVAGLIKMILAMQNKQLPPLAHFQAPNPDIDFESTPFFIQEELTDWNPEGPRRAGISSFGFGGTNAHLILEEAPEIADSGPSRSLQVVPLSAGSADGLEQATTDLLDHLRGSSSEILADCAYTLSVGRRAFAHRRVVLAEDRDSLVRSLESGDPSQVISAHHDGPARNVVFLFSGQGSQYVNMGRELYQEEETFRAVFDECCELLSRLGFGKDLKALLFPEGAVSDELTEELKQTGTTQVALFVVELALARLWMSWGVQPAACLGHSIGEYVAACVAGVFTLEDALKLVMLRGQGMESMPRGTMLAVPLPEEEVQPHLEDGLWLSVINGPSLCVVSGSAEKIDELTQRLAAKGVDCQALHTSHAFHSGMMEGAVAPFVQAVSEVQRGAAEIPFLSNVSGDWITAQQIENPEYWGSQIRQPVRFSQGLARAAEKPDQIYLEVGPGNTLSMLARRQLGAGAHTFHSLPHPREGGSAHRAVLMTLGRLWLAGADIDWKLFYGDQDRRRVPLPTYPFEKTRFWVERRTKELTQLLQKQRSEGRIADPDQWLYIPSWKRADLPRPLKHSALENDQSQWMVFLDDADLGESLVKTLEAAGQSVVAVRRGESFAETEDGFTIHPLDLQHYEKVIQQRVEEGKAPQQVLFLFGVSKAGESLESTATDLGQGFGSLLLLGRALGESSISEQVRVGVITNGAVEVSGREPLSPAKAAMLGVSRVIAQEYPHLTCRNFDLAELGDDPWTADRLDRLLQDFLSDSVDSLIAYRGSHRWIESFEQLRLPELSEEAATGCLRDKGFYFITGGLGEIGLEFAEYLARTVQARLLLTSRGGLPEPTQWEEYLSSHAEHDAVSMRIRRVQALEALGAEVVVAAADAADEGQMKAALEAAEQRFGELRGVIHAAGVVTGDAFRSIAETDQELCQRQFAPKVFGLGVLDRMLEGRSVDFCMLVSSLSSVLGGIRYAAYASGNAYMDAFAYLRNRTSEFPWITVNWDAWLRRADVERLEKANVEPTGLVMKPAEGVAVFSRLLAVEGGTQIVVSVGDLQTRLAQWVQSKSKDSADDEDDPERHPRPRLQTEYTEPASEAEKKIAALWQELLGIEQVGANDNFFELGGDSFLGIQVIARMKKELKVNVSAASLYEGPTVRSLARIASEDSEEQDEAFDQVRSRGEMRRSRQRRRQPTSE